MIIDMHVHPFCKEAYWGDDLNFVADALLGSNKKGRRAMFKFYEVLLTKISIADYVTQMEKYRIDKAIIVSYNLTTAYGVCIVTNDNIADFVKMYPDKFIGFACIDVPALDALDQLEYAVSSLELKGVKLVPPAQKFDISDKKYDTLWKKMVDFNIPLWTHTSHLVSIVGAISKYGHPMLIDELASRHQDLTIIMGHMGVPWFWDAWGVVIRHPNVYIDISTYSDLYQWFPFEAFSKYNAEDKVLFASDYPFEHWNKIVPAAQNLPISEGFKEAILYKNAMKLLKL